MHRFLVTTMTGSTLTTRHRRETTPRPLLTHASALPHCRCRLSVRHIVCHILVVCYSRSGQPTSLEYLIAIHVRYLSVVNMPCYHHLFTMNHRICDTWSIWVHCETISLQFRSHFSIEQCLLGDKGCSLRTVEQGTYREPSPSPLDKWITDRRAKIETIRAAQYCILSLRG